MVTYGEAGPISENKGKNNIQERLAEIYGPKIIDSIDTMLFANAKRTRCSLRLPMT